MNKDTIIVILAALLMLSVGGVAYLSIKGKPILVGQEAGKEICDFLPLYTGPTENGGGFLQPYFAQDVCRLVFAHEKGDLEICKKMKIREAGGMCYSMVAIKKGDASLCDSAPADMKDVCYRQAAEKLDGIKICEKIGKGDDRDNCLMNYAGKSGDASVCKKITNVYTRDNCYMNQAYRNPELCQEISNLSTRQDCERNVRR